MRQPPDPAVKVGVAGRELGAGRPCFIIAEMGLGHDGSLGLAHAFIDSVARAGADAVKFQTHLAGAESTDREQFRVKVFPQDATRKDYWLRTAFTPQQWRGLKEHADDARLAFLSTPFSLEAVELLIDVGVPAWKIGSGETNNSPLLEAVAATGLPVLLSTGMSYLAEVDATVGALKEWGSPLVLFQCTNRYPCPPESLGLNVLEQYSRRYQVPVGLSDHSGTPAAGLAAATLGAASIEVHATWHRECFGPDVPASLTMEELSFLVKGVRFIEQALANPVDKDAEADGMTDIRELFTKSVVAARDLEQGRALRLEDLAFKKPGTGIPAADFRGLVGKRLKRGLGRDELIAWGDLD